MQALVVVPGFLRNMRRVRISSHRSPVQKLGDSQMKLSPKFKLAVSPSSPSLCQSPTQPSADPLIPDLPDDIALNCLLRLPVESHRACRLVCRRWRRLLASKECFFSQRRALGFHDPWLFTLAFHRCTGKIQWQVLDLTHFCWHTIPPMPCRERACPRGFGCMAVPPGGTLLVCGGLVSDMECPLHLVLKFEMHMNRWTVMRRMLTARSFFAGGVIDGQVYVAGGYSADQFELDSAEALDPIEGSWRSVASMGMNMASYDSAVLNGKLYVTEGCVWPFLSSRRGEIYDPKTDSWETMPAGMREGWTGSSVVVDERLFVISDYETMKVKTYDMVSDSWDDVEGPSMPDRIHRPFCVTSIGPRIIAVGRGLHVVIGTVERKNGCSGCNASEPEKAAFSIQWQELDASSDLCDLTPSSAQILYG